MVINTGIDIINNYVNDTYTFNELIEKAIEFFGSNAAYWDILCPNKHTIKINPMIDEKDVYLATKCKKCDLTSLSGLFSNQQVKLKGLTLFIFPFYKKTSNIQPCI